MDAFQFIKDVAVDWDKSLYIEAEPGEYIITARHPKAIKTGDEWFVGGISGENAYETTVKLDFLTPGATYKATLYADGPDADYETNPQSYEIKEFEVTSASEIPVRMARSGGFALSLKSL